MYYLLTTERIITENDLRLAYEICCGNTSNRNPEHYEKWIHTTLGIVRSIPKNEIDVEQLAKGGCKVEAVKMYRAKNCCTLREAKEAIDKM